MRDTRLAKIIFACLLQFTAIISTAPAQAGSLDNYYISLNNYFSSIPALPITAPQGEKAGDVYDEPGVIYDRKRSCFNEAKTEAVETYLVDNVYVNKSNISASVDFEQEAIGQAAARAGVELYDIVTISYGQNGKVTWEQLLPSDIEALLKKEPNINACRQNLLKILRTGESVPWIIQSVWRATVNVSARTASALGSNGSAKLDSELTPLKASGAVTTKRETNSIVVVSTGKTPFPIAWRPAFISTAHYHYVKELMDQTWFRFLLSKAGFRMSDTEIFRTLREDFKFDKKVIPSPEYIRREMSRGPAMPFDEKNNEHLEYLKGVNVLYGLAEADKHLSRS